MFHVPFEANRCSEHVTVLRNVTDMFARLTLNICKEGAPVAVEAGKAMLLAKGVRRRVSCVHERYNGPVAGAPDHHGGIHRWNCWDGPTNQDD